MPSSSAARAALARHDLLMLGIETSCNDTAAAVVRGDREILSQVVSSQADLLARYGGVAPKMAEEAHALAIDQVVQKALNDANCYLLVITNGAEAEAMAEVASALRAVGEGFLRVEERRLQMALQMEKERMKSEMKRTQTLLDAQQLFVEAFLGKQQHKKAKGVSSAAAAAPMDED